MLQLDQTSTSSQYTWQDSEWNKGFKIKKALGLGLDASLFQDDSSLSSTATLYAVDDDYTGATPVLSMPSIDCEPWSEAQAILGSTTKQLTGTETITSQQVDVTINCEYAMCSNRMYADSG